MIKVRVEGKWNGYTGEVESKITPLPKLTYTPEQIAAFTALCKVLPLPDRKKIWNEINNSGCKIPVDGQQLRESLTSCSRKGLRWE